MKKAEKEKDKASEIRLQQIKKSLGITDDSVRLADQYIAVKDVIPTGLPELDKILTPMIYEKTGQGGIPRGFCCEFFGPHAGGKSSLGMKLAAYVTTHNGFVLWVDAEGSFVPEWAKRHGADTGKIIHVENEGKTGEQFLEMVETIASKGQVDLIVIDSVTALQPKEILETALEKEARIGAGAKMMARALPRILMAAKKGNTAVIFINQIRQKIGVFYGSNETTPYGEALKFYCSLRLRLSQVGSKSERGIMKGDDEIGIRTNVQVVKSRFGPPYREAVMPIYYSDVKPHPLDMIIDAALSAKVAKSRSKKQPNGESLQMFTFGDERFEGIEEFKSWLINNPKKTKEMVELIKTTIPLGLEVDEYIKTAGDVLDTDDSDTDAKVATGAEDDPGAADKPGA